MAVLMHPRRGMKSDRALPFSGCIPEQKVGREALPFNKQMNLESPMP
jgi:hypothetical protein